MTGYVASLCAIADMIDAGPESLGFLEEFVFVMRHLAGDRLDAATFYLDSGFDSGELREALSHTL